MLRSVLFQIAYLTTSALFVLTALPLLMLPNRAPLSRWIRLYSQTIVFIMRRVGGVNVNIKGQDHLPDGPVIIAAKHQSWGDGFVVHSQIPDLAFVTGDHLLRYPLLGPILRKLGAIVVNNCGGSTAQSRLMALEMKEAQAENRSILIYPEGHLSPIGEQHRYRKGVFHLYKTYGCPVVPVATDLGLRWPESNLRLHPGPASVEFLRPIPPGLDKETFMAELERMVETRSIALLKEQDAAGTWPTRRPRAPIVASSP